MGEIVIEESNYRAIAMVLANLFMLIAFFAITVFGFTKARISYWLPGLLVGMVFLVGLLVAITKAAKEKRLLTITMDGIIDSSSLGGFGFISFDDIREFQILNLYRTRVIAVIPKNEDVFLSKLSMTKRTQVKTNLIMKQPPVTINVEQAKNMEPEDILSLLQKRLMDYSSLYE